MLFSLQVTQSTAQIFHPASFETLSSNPNTNLMTTQNSTAPLQTSQKNSQSSTAPFSRVSSSSSPVCLHPKSPTYPHAAALRWSFTSDDSIDKACNSRTWHVSSVPRVHTFLAFNNSYYFNISLQDPPIISTPSSIPSPLYGNQDCSNSFNAIFSSCVSAQGFWGGWVATNGINYTGE